jgi:heme/copper-type cytochrome/quinol oxidase subunit 2
VLVLIVVAGLVAYYQSYQSAAAPQGKTETVKVDIKSVTENGVEHHVFDPGTVTVHKGDHIVLMVTNNDEHPHGIAIADLNLDTGALTDGQTAKLEFDATSTGTFTMRCSVPGCAPDHAQMLGQLVVVD